MTEPMPDRLDPWPDSPDDAPLDRRVSNDTAIRMLYATARENHERLVRIHAEMKSGFEQMNGRVRAIEVEAVVEQARTEEREKVAAKAAEAAAVVANRAVSTRQFTLGCAGVVGTFVGIAASHPFG